MKLANGGAERVTAGDAGGVRRWGDGERSRIRFLFGVEFAGELGMVGGDKVSE